ncbi:pseudouridine-5'-phosphate glycosidase-like [Planococcus citri]|uniref:pseudouridine-5'-phosphate glycosidase-like n=1 Tax=Planococcus citri TaxID=170843 RepID=UPI0031F9E63F
MFQHMKRFCHSLIDVAKPVATALAENRPVVALETTILTHGMPYPINLQTALAVEELVKEQGSVPATIGVMNGRIKVGLDEQSLAVLASSDTESIKISRRDFPVAISRGLCGGTTVAGTLVVSKLVGIDVFVTGGIGGVHRDVTESMDISADLMELSRSPIMVVSSGIKSILDISRTLEYLETLGVCVVTYDDSKDFPAFYTRKSGHQSVYNVTTPLQAAELLYNVKKLGLESGILLGVPIPEQYSLNEQSIQNAIENALKCSKEKGLSGKTITPFILGEVSKITEGRSLDSNIALIKNNAVVGSKIAVALKEKKFLQSSSGSTNSHRKYSTRAVDIPKNFPSKKVVVIGGSNMDILVRPDEPLQVGLGLHDGNNTLYLHNLFSFININKDKKEYMITN